MSLANILFTFRSTVTRLGVEETLDFFLNFLQLLLCVVLEVQKKIHLNPSKFFTFFTMSSCCYYQCHLSPTLPLYCASAFSNYTALEKNLKSSFSIFLNTDLNLLL